MSASLTISAVAAKRGIERVVDDIYELGKSKFGGRLRRWKARKQIDTLYRKIKQVRFVKTIWQVEKQVDLLKFYYPSKIKVGDERRTINDLSDIDYAGNILVEGTVGQGKSIFFRYLTSREMVKGAAVPLFVELRRIRADEQLVDHLITELQTLGLDVDTQTFEFLASNGKLILFLDGFDEVPEQRRAGLITEIERLGKRFESLRIFISSRPNSGIANSVFFHVVQLCPLEEDEYEDVIRRVTDDQTTASRIIEGVKQAKTRVRELLTTPLMVALLVFRYKAEQAVPENVIAFYDHLFDLLLHRHDRSKAGYVRPRKSGLGDTALQDIFSAICFLTRKASVGTLTLAQIRTYAGKAISLVGHDADPSRALDDIIEITCLILEEGGECKFLHKSVQEYHAAHFVQGQPDDLAIRFYKGMSGTTGSAAIETWNFWSNELAFLSMIDEYRFAKSFLIPHLREILGIGQTPVPQE